MPTSHIARPRRAFRAARCAALAATALLTYLSLTLTTSVSAAEPDDMTIMQGTVIVEEFEATDSTSRARPTATPRPTSPRDISFTKVVDKSSPL